MATVAISRYATAGSKIMTDTSLVVSAGGETADLTSRSVQMPQREEHALNRRAFFGAACREIAVGSLTLNSANVLMGQMSTASLVGPSSEYNCMNERVILPSGHSFHNLGVEHLGSQFLRYAELILGEIDKCDTVLLEGFKGQDYFDMIAGVCRSKGIEVVRLESDMPIALNVALANFNILKTGMVVSNLWHYLGRAFSLVGSFTRPQSGQDKSKEPSKASSAEILSGYQGPGLGRTFLTTCLNVLDVFWGINSDYRKAANNRENYPIDSINYTVDGRTVFMLREIERYLGVHPARRVLVITGASHAQGFSYYTSTPQRFEEYKLRQSLFEKIYEPLTGGKAAVESRGR